MEVTIGYSIQKPVATQAECDAYSAMVLAVSEHNAGAAESEQWKITEKEDCYEVELVPPLTAEELAAQEEARKKAEEEAKQRAQKQAELEALPDVVAALKAQQADTDSLLVEQEYRLTLMELGVDETETA